jgi:predicted nuclease of predicted toxin-antitoxin system
VSDPAGTYLILDQGVPRDAAAILCKSGFACHHAGEIGLSRAEDIEILQVARARKAVIVTLDADFHSILAVTDANGPSVIRLRLQGLDGPKVALLVVNLAEHSEAELARGCMITVKARKTTCGMLPVVARPLP